MQTSVQKRVAGSSACEMRVRLKGIPQLMHEYDEVQKQLELYDDGSEQHEHDRELYIKLTVIQLPTFSGNVTEFRHFQDTVISLVINNNSLDNIQKHHYFTLASNLKAIEALELKIPLHEVLLSQLVLDRLLDEQDCKEWEVSSSSNQPGQVKRITQADGSCMRCHEMHALYRCHQFLNGNFQECTEFVSQTKLCFNCLQVEHIVRQCTSGSCHKCGRKHKTLLHREAKSPQVEDQNKTSQISRGRERDVSEDYGDNRSSSAQYCSLNVKLQTHILEPIAKVRVRNNTGRLHTCRALLDSCSQAHFVSESLVQRIALKKFSNCVALKGINTVRAEAKYSATVQILSMTTN
ncbi:hypothetical protein PR048_018069 [Dryococelus australis]|uniref:CCHC-type domain-containing protein n=1 Tax=Dryococelus australis TaxID=614101 RepID=A0ABQ9HBE1_9NEOP|nr:hypothetical protein PR048_018069 [Dryococelus australis]